MLFRINIFLRRVLVLVVWQKITYKNLVQWKFYFKYFICGIADPLFIIQLIFQDVLRAQNLWFLFQIICKSYTSVRLKSPNDLLILDRYLKF